MSQDLSCVNALISGKVQGVFFRSALKSVAEQAGLKGWVRNKPDGKVEALFQGAPDALKQVLKWCERGPEGAKVDSVEIKEIQCVEKFRNFSILY